MRSLAASVCVFLVLSPTQVIADPNPPEPSAPQQRDVNMQKAQERFKDAEVAYQLGDFDTAIAGYEDAFRLSKQPGLLFNLAQAYRLKGDSQKALTTYRSYLRSQPTAENRAFVEERIAEMEAKVEAERAERERERERQAALAAAAKPKTVIIREKARGRSLRISGAITGAVGVLALGGGTLFAFKARSAWGDINALSDDRGVWSEGFAKKYDSAEQNETRAVLFFAAGSAAVVAGGLLYFLGRPRDDDASGASVQIAPTDGGAQFVLTWRE